MTLQARLRKKLTVPRTDIVEVWFDDGAEKVEVRAITVAQQHRIYKQASRPKAPGSDETEIDGALLEVLMLIAACYDPESGEAAFDAAQRDEMLNTYNSGALNALFRSVSELNGQQTSTEERARELKGDPTDGSSSG